MSVYRRTGSKRWTVSVDIGMEPDENGRLRRVRHQETSRPRGKPKHVKQHW